MSCTLTARRLKPGMYDDFRSAWSGGEEGRPEGAERWRQVYHCRDVEDENVIVSFGFFQGSLTSCVKLSKRSTASRRSRI